MADPVTVKRALDALASDPPARRSPRSVVVDAETALESVRTAADFVVDGGERDLASAVADAARRDDGATARRGRRVQARLERYRAAANASKETDAATLDGDAGTDESGVTLARGLFDAGAENATDRDHFHSGRGTVLEAAGQSRRR